MLNPFRYRFRLLQRPKWFGLRLNLGRFQNPNPQRLKP
jgi:hypothetical protein